jgi:hypothetical protein
VRGGVARSVEGFVCGWFSGDVVCVGVSVVSCGDVRREATEGVGAM